VPFPLTDRAVYANNPLEEVICQLRFPPILKIGVEPPAAFQERIRKRYPLYEHDAGGAPEIPRTIANLLEELRVPNPIVGFTTPRHKFSTADDKRSVVLTNDFLALTEKGYERWERLRDEIHFSEQQFRDEYAPEFYTRVGLRYRDRILRSKLGLENVGWHDLLNHELTGLLGDERFAGLIRSARAEVELTLPNLEDARLNLRYGLQPPRNEQEASYVIDADLYVHGRYKTEYAFKILDNFHTIAGNLFRWAISGRLRDALGPRRLDAE